MKNIFSNKKILIPIIACVIVIIIAIVVFILIGNDRNPNITEIKFNETTADGNTVNQVNEVDNEVEENRDDENIPDFYRNAAEQFVNGIMSTEEMDIFLDEYLDAKAYVAYNNIDGNDEEFLDEYQSISDDDEQITEITDTFSQIASDYENILALGEAMENTSNIITDNETDNESNETEDNTASNTSEDTFNTDDYMIEVVSINNLQESDVVEAITKVDVTLSMGGEEAVITMVFYDEFVIYIEDENGESFIHQAISSTIDNQQ